MEFVNYENNGEMDRFFSIVAISDFNDRNGP
jgi:hypothetical protein